MLREQLNRVYDAVNQIQDVREQLEGLRKRLGPGGSSKALLDGVTALDAKLMAARDPLINFQISASEDSLAYAPGIDGKLAFLSMTVAGFADSAPTAAEYQEFDKLKKQTDELLAHWEQVRSVDIGSFQKLAAEQNVHSIYVPDVKSERVVGGGGGEEEEDRHHHARRVRGSRSMWGWLRAATWVIALRGCAPAPQVQSLDKHLVLRDACTVSRIAALLAEEDLDSGRQGRHQAVDLTQRGDHGLVDDLAGLFDFIHRAIQEFIGADDLQTSAVEGIGESGINAGELVASRARWIRRRWS